MLCGGGTNHRLDLASGILIKNNHISLGGGLPTVLSRALEYRQQGQRVQVEARSAQELEEALAFGAEAILLDNMTPEQVRQSVARIRQFKAEKAGHSDSHRGFRRHESRHHPRLCRDWRGLYQRRRANPLGQGGGYFHAHRSGDGLVRGTALDLYDLAALEAALAGTVFAGKLHFSPVTDSTNSDAQEAARSGAPHGSVYFADEQLAGRGRGDHSWLSEMSYR